MFCPMRRSGLYFDSLRLVIPSSFGPPAGLAKCEHPALLCRKPSLRPTGGVLKAQDAAAGRETSCGPVSRARNAARSRRKASACQTACRPFRLIGMGPTSAPAENAPEDHVDVT